MRKITAFFSVLLFSFFASAERGPNVVLIFTDDLDFDEIGTYDPMGYPTHTAAKRNGFSNRGHWGFYPQKPVTPNIDSIASGGIRFMRFYVPITVCTPSHALLTGQRCGRSAAVQERFSSDQEASVEFTASLLPEEWNVARALQAVGYRTGFVGKWHLLSPSVEQKLLPEDSMSIEEMRRAQSPVSEKLLNDLKRRYGIFQTYIRDQYGFDFVDGLYVANKNQTGMPDAWLPEGNMEWMTWHAVRFIEANKDHPFFLQFAPNVPHGMHGPRHIWEGDSRTTPAGLVEEHIGTQPSFEDIRNRIKEQGLDSSAAIPMYLDDGVGVILKTLRDLGLEQDTLIVFASDHQSRGKWTAYEAAHIPALAMWPGKIKAGRVSDLFCSTLDLAPTLLDVCGAAPPAAGEGMLDGRSLKHMLLDESAQLPEQPFLIEMGYAKAVLFQNWKYIAVRYPENNAGQIMKRTGGRPDYRGARRWTNVDVSIFPNVSAREQLYDLNADPFEQTNLVNDERLAGKVMEMRQYMSQLAKELPHPFGEFTSEEEQ